MQTRYKSYIYNDSDIDYTTTTAPYHFIAIINEIFNVASMTKLLLGPQQNVSSQCQIIKPFRRPLLPHWDSYNASCA